MGCCARRPREQIETALTADQKAPAPLQDVIAMGSIAWSACGSSPPSLGDTHQMPLDWLPIDPEANLAVVGVAAPVKSPLIAGIRDEGDVLHDLSVDTDICLKPCAP